MRIVILGAGPAGLNAALEARALGLSSLVLDAAEPLATIAAFPVAKPIFTYPRAWEPAGAMRVSARVKEPLLAELRSRRRTCIRSKGISGRSSSASPDTTASNDEASATRRATAVNTAPWSAMGELTV